MKQVGWYVRKLKTEFGRRYRPQIRTGKGVYTIGPEFSTREDAKLWLVEMEMGKFDLKLWTAEWKVK